MLWLFQPFFKIFEYFVVGLFRSYIVWQPGLGRFAEESSLSDRETYMNMSEEEGRLLPNMTAPGLTFSDFVVKIYTYNIRKGEHYGI